MEITGNLGGPRGAGPGQPPRTLKKVAWLFNDAVARQSDLADDEHFLAARRLVDGVVAAGSYKKYVRTPLQDTLNLLSLAQSDPPFRPGEGRN